MNERHILAIGGAGFDATSAPLLDYILGLARSERPRVAFVPTASGDSAEYVTAFYTGIRSRARGTLAPAALHAHRDLPAYLLQQDVVYVGGGNTANMRVVWRVHGVDAILRSAWEHGVVLCGPSAGGNCWFEACVTDSFGRDLAPLDDGLGFLAGSFCPHDDSEAQRRPTYRRLVADGFPPG